MATVFLARLGGAGGFQRLYAIKRLHPHLASDGEFIQMFLDEARVAARIHHPNVVPILEIGTDSEAADGDADRYYLVMEYIEGDTVARLIARSAHAGRKLPAGVGIRILVDALAGLHAAHELRDDDGALLEIVHRDVSPQNILVGVDGVARITDFGVARAASRLSTTRSGQLKGKLAYMAPEQARAGKIDRRADVFAMGICLWETLASKRLFKGEGEAETLNRVLYEPIPVLRSVVPTVPDALNVVCMKALERDPDRRYATAADFGNALEAAAQSLKVLGSTRDVIAYVEEIMGADLAQQREALRAWRARSEPGRKDSTAPPRLGTESVTRVERPGSSVTPPGVSSVSSATLQVPPSSPSSTSAVGGTLPQPSVRPEAPRGGRRRAALWSIALLATAAVAAGAGMKWRPGGLKNVAGLQALAPLTPHGEARGAARQDAPAPAIDRPDLEAPPSASRMALDASSEAHPVRAEATGSARTAPPAPAPRGPHPRLRTQGASPGPVKPLEPEPGAPASVPVAPAPAPAASQQPATAPVPDDISHNPYR